MNLDTALDLEREPHGSSDDPDPLDFGEHQPRGSAGR